jgi:sugar phosphate isomerase/epimerase
MDRRTFLGALTAAAALPGVVQEGALLAAGAARLDRIGVQLYTVRGLLSGDFDGTLARIAEIGYREVEFAGYFGRTPAQVRDALHRAGLTAPSAHVPFEAIDEGWDAALHTARLIGHEYLVCAWIPEERRRTLDDWHRVAARLDQAGTAAHDAGIQLAYHNHSYEFVPTAGRLPYDVLLDATDPTLLQLELDVFWITFGHGARRAAQSAGQPADELCLPEAVDILGPAGPRGGTR